MVVSVVCGLLSLYHYCITFAIRIIAQEKMKCVSLYGTVLVPFIVRTDAFLSMCLVDFFTSERRLLSKCIIMNQCCVVPPSYEIEFLFEKDFVLACGALRCSMLCETFL